MRADNSARPSFEAAWQRRFEEFATLRDDDAGIAGWSSTGLAARFRHFLRLWNRSQHGRLWLDAGCGAGTYGRYLASRGADVVALDYCLPAVSKAKSRDRWNCRWAVADIKRLPLPTAHFDGVLCFGVTQALAESGSVVRAMTSAVGEGGEVWVDGLNAFCLANLLRRLTRYLKGKPRHLRYESPRRLRRLMIDAGLTEVRISWIPLLPWRLHALQPIIESTPAQMLLHYVPILGVLLSHAFVIHGVKRGASSD